jgi:EAL domain-containing protein (putative c-di-GMP-specific phosphodiesterase class I)
VYQPIVSWSHRCIVAYEALVRSSDPELFRPDLLFESAEELGQLHRLGRKIRRAVSADMGQLDPAVELFVNLHPEDLLDEELFSPDADLSRLAGRVVLEITERASLDSITDLRERLDRFRNLGFTIAVDDLGSGYAGLSAFTQIQPNVAKIDMSLVRGVNADTVKRRVVKGMVSVCNQLGIRVVCEGIETTAERDTLAELGCDLMQGYLFAKPDRVPPLVRL